MKKKQGKPHDYKWTKDVGGVYAANPPRLRPGETETTNVEVNGISTHVTLTVEETDE